MPDFIRDDWRTLPNGILEQDERQTAAKTWGAQARAELATSWADAQRSELAQLYPDLAAGAGAASVESPMFPAAGTTSPYPSPGLTSPAPEMGGPATASLSRSPLNDISQFGDATLTAAEAAAACGPASASRLASIFGNNIPLRQALDAAMEVGWTADGGMNGIANEKRLLDKLGIPATMDTNPSMDKVISDASSGNPVTVSTPNHYFTLAGYDAETKMFDVGQSGLAFRGGSTHMTWDQIRRLGGGINGALFVDSPASPHPGTAALEMGQTDGYTPSSLPQPTDFGASMPAPTMPANAPDMWQPITPTPGFSQALADARAAAGYTEPSSQAQPGFDEMVPQPFVDSLSQRVPQQNGFSLPSMTDIPGVPKLRSTAPKDAGEAIGQAGEDLLNRSYPGLGPGGLGLVDPRIGPQGGEEGAGKALQGPADELLRSGLEGIGGAVSRVGAGAAEAVVAAAEAATKPHGLTINLPKYTPPEVRDIIQQAYDAAAPTMDAARRGVIPDEVVRDLAEQVGRSPAQIAALWKPGQAKNAETILALREGLASAGKSVLDAQESLRANPASADALNAVTEALTRHAAIQETVTGVTAEAGRALRQFRQPVSGQQFAVQQLQRIAKATKMAPDELATHLATVDLADPGKVANLARTLTQHSFGDKFSALWYFSLLSSPVTHIKNTLSNALVLASRPIESTVSAAVDTGRAALTQTSRERFFGEVPAEIVGATAGLSDGVKSAYQILRQGFSDAELSAKPELATSEPFRGRIADLTVNAPGRALRASDTFFRALNSSASIYADAYRLASKEGLKGQEFLDNVAQRIANPTTEMLDRAQKEAAYRVFQQDGTFVRKVGGLRQDLPALRLLVPFVQTPYNIAKYALERTPLAFGKMLSEVATSGGRAELSAKGGGDLSDRIARAAIGGATLYALKNYADSGNLTGAAPIDAAEKDAFYRQGRQPYSMKNPVTGEWFSYAGLQPFTTVFAAAAQMSNMLKKGDQDALTGIAIGSLALGRATLDQPWTDGLSEFLDFMSGSRVSDAQSLADTAGKYAARQSSSLVPGIVRWLARAGDPTVRDPDPGFAGVGQTIESNVPGLQGQVPARQTAFGQPSPRPITGAQTLNPLAASQPNNDPVERELARLQAAGFDVQPGYVSKRITIGSESVKLSDTEQHRYQESAGLLAYQLLATAVGSKEWTALSDAGKAKAADRIVERAREAARNELAPQLRSRAIEQRQKRLAGATP